MRPTLLLSIVLVLFFSCFTQSFSIGSKKFNSIYYVDSENGNDLSNGKTTNAAWKSISKVNSTSFQPGDQILFKRGGTWFETLLVNSSGTTRNPIKYSAYGDNNLPLPVIDGQMTRNNCIYIYSKNYVQVSNIRMQNAAGSGQIRVMYSNNIVIEYCSFLVTGHGGVFIETSTNCVVNKNDITSPAGDFTAQTDGIYSQRNSDNVYERNTIVLNNENLAGHLDGIQSYIDNNLTVRNNFIHQQNSKPNGQGIYATTGKGVHTYYNNVVYAPNATASGIGFKNLATGTGTLRAYHNTVICKGANILSLNGDAAPVVKNNIFVALSPSHGIIRVDSTVLDPSNINNNVYKNGGNSICVTYKGSNITFAQWKALGFETSGMYGDPMLEANYKLKPGSPAINTGTDVGSQCVYDKAGTIRPQMGVVDIGAYESFYNGKDASTDLSVTTFELSQNYPNPFNPTTNIRFSLPEASDVSLKIYDILGTEVATLIDENKNGGVYEVEFNGEALASGTYIYQTKTNSFVETKKMILLK